MRDELDLTAKDYRARFEVSGTEEAIAKVGLLQGAIDNLPEEQQITVTQQILEGDYVGALETVQDYYDQHPAVVDVEFNPLYPSGFVMSGGALVPGPRSLPPTGEGAEPMLMGATPTATSSYSMGVPVIMAAAAEGPRDPSPRDGQHGGGR